VSVMECRLSIHRAQRFLSVLRSGERDSTDEGGRSVWVGDTSAEALTRVFVSMCAAETREDGLTFLPESAQVEAIRARIVIR